MATKKVDPRIYVPLVENYEYEDATDKVFGDANLTNPVVIEFDSGNIIGMQPPESITVLEQIVRKSPDGRSVVDLVIEVQDMPGASEYEVRTAIV